MSQQDVNFDSTLEDDANLDLISGEPGAHPAAVGLGAVGTGIAAGAMGGAVGGPIGAIAGASIGAVVGGLIGSDIGEDINPTFDREYWRSRHDARPYAIVVYPFDEYEPAYRYGWETGATPDYSITRSFEDAETQLSNGWDKAKGTSRLAWDDAKAATREAWNRVTSAGRAARTAISTPSHTR